MEYTVQNLEYAVSVFYNGEQTERAKAHTWLTDAQRVPEAWNFVWELLQPAKNTEVQFYAATTLHTKILRCWNEVPPESHEELKQKLLLAVITYSRGPKIVTNRLCISLAAFILQQGVTDLGAVLGPLSTADNTSLLLEVLTVIPEEYNSMTMGTALRKKNRAALQRACTMVLDDMLRYLQTVYNDYSKEPPTDEVVQSWLAVATCAGSWLALGDDDLDAASAALAERAPLCRALITAVHVIYTWNECVCDAALEACEACLGAVRAAATANGAERHERAAASILADLAALAAPLLAAHNVPNSINEELIAAMVTCCVAVVECHSRMVVAGVQAEPPLPAARQILELMLAAQAAPGHYPLHETRSHLVFGLWYTLQDEILHSSDGREHVKVMWKEVFSQLLVILIAKCEAPAEQALSRDDEELLRCYRQDVSDTVLYCYCVLGERCWHLVEAALTEATTEARREAALHVFQALADTLTGDAPACLLRTLQHAVHLVNTSQARRTLDTALDCLGSYAVWVGSMEGGGELASECVRAAGGALARAPAAAALALRKLCDDNAAPAAACAGDIVRAAQSAEGRSDAWVRRQLISAAGAALAAAEPERAAPALDELARSLHDELAAQVEVASRATRADAGGAEAARARAGAEAELAAKCAAALLAALQARPALAERLLAALMPALGDMPPHAALVEPMFHMLKQAVLTMTDASTSLLEEIAQLTVRGFDTMPTPVGLDTVKLIMMPAAKSWPGVGRLLRACVVASARTVAREPAARPDLAEALFTLLHVVHACKGLKETTLAEAVDDLLPELIELACRCMTSQEAGAARASCIWLAALAARRAEALQPRAHHLVDTLLRCIGGATPRSHMEPLAALLLALNKATWNGAELGAWLRPALAAPAFPSPHAAPHHRDAFLAAVLKEKVSKRRTLEAVQEFWLACRGLIGTEYARQTLSSKQMVA